MRKVLRISFFILLFTSLSYGQLPTVEPKMVGVFKPTYYEDIYEKLDNLLIELGNEINPEKNYLAIRICSNDPLPVAYSLAKGMPQYVIENLKRYNPSLELNRPKILILKNNINCKIKKNEYFLTEYWVVTNNTRNLKFAESESSDNILVSEFKVDKNHLLKSNNEILKALKNKKKSWLVINLSSKNKMIPLQIRKLQKFLKNNHVKKDRIFIKNLLTTNEKNGDFKIFLAENKT